jgi:hypothetical protein
MIRGGDFSMLKVWAGLEARSFLQASIESVRISLAVIYYSPKTNLFSRSKCASNMIYCRQMFDFAQRT